MSLDEKTVQTIADLEDIITTHYPGARFALGHGVDDPTSLNLMTTVDVEDVDEVLEKVLDRVVELNVKEGVPVHVVPVHTPERRAAARLSRRPKERGSLRHRLPFLPR